MVTQPSNYNPNPIIENQGMENEISNFMIMITFKDMTKKWSEDNIYTPSILIFLSAFDLK